MGKFNLNKSRDFARLTMSTASEGAQLLQSLFGSEWEIEESAYGHPAGIAQAVIDVGDTGVPVSANTLLSGLVVFHIFKSSADYGGAVSEVRDTNGRRKVKFNFPFKDGQTTADLGSKAQNFEFDILLHGEGYKEAMTSLLEEFNDPKPGLLVHPVLGPKTVVVEDWQVTHRHDNRNAVLIKAVFTEHTFNVKFSIDSVFGLLSTIRSLGKGLKKIINAAVSAMKFIDKVITDIEGKRTLLSSLKALLAARLAEYKALYSTTLSQLNQTFNTDTSDDIPGLVPVSQGGQLNEDGTLLSGTFPLVTSPEDPFRGVPLNLLAPETVTALAVSQAENKVNTLRASANSLIDFMRDSLDGQGALEFYEQIQVIKKTAILIQTVFENGVASSNVKVVDYTTPRVMTIREVAFQFRQPLAKVLDIELLNPTLLSVNYIEKGTVLKVPVS